jgi:hypothetical protein
MQISLKIGAKNNYIRTPAPIQRSFTSIIQNINNADFIENRSQKNTNIQN